MKKIGLVLCLLIFVNLSVFGMFVEVGNQTSNSYLMPVNGWYDYSWSRTIYLQSELVNEMNITEISYNVSNDDSNCTMNEQSYYMRHTTDTLIVSTDYVNPELDTSYQLVFSGTTTFNETGWHNIILSNNFSYNGVDNLEIVVVNNDGSYNPSYPYFFVTNDSVNRSVYDKADGSFPTSSGILSAFYPNIRFYYLSEGMPGVPLLTSPLNNAINMPVNSSLEWIDRDNTNYSKIHIANNDNFNDATIINPATSPYTPTLEINTTYYWKVEAVSPTGISNISET